MSDAGFDVWYEQQVISNDGAYTFNMDVLIRPYNIAIEIDGWNHESRRAKSKDRWKDSECAKVGVKVVRIPISEAQGAPEQILKTVWKIAKRRQKRKPPSTKYKVFSWS